MTQPGRRGVGGLRFRCLDYGFDVAVDAGSGLATAVVEALAGFRTDAPPQASYRLRARAGGAGFTVELDGAELFADPSPATALDYFFWHVDDTAARRERRRLLVHAGVVVAPSGQAVVLMAPSGQGKSTTTYALVRAGFGHLSDEYAVVDPGSMTLSAYPRPITLRPGARSWFPEAAALAVAPSDSSGGVRIPVSRLRPGALAALASPGWLVVLNHEPAGETRLSPISRGNALMHMAPQTFGFRDRAPQLLPAMAELARRSETYALTTRDVPSAVAAVSGMTAGG